MTNKIIEVASVGLVCRNRILLIKRGKEPSKGCYAFPGGRIEADETAEIAARREVLEETGVTAGQLEPLETLNLGDADGDPGSAAYLLYVFHGKHDGGEPIAGDDADDAGWFKLTEVETLPMTPSSLRLARVLLGNNA